LNDSGGKWGKRAAQELQKAVAQRNFARWGAIGRGQYGEKELQGHCPRGRVKRGHLRSEEEEHSPERGAWEESFDIRK